jgi:hypothetical protein
MQAQIDQRRHLSVKTQAGYTNSLRRVQAWGQLHRLRVLASSAIELASMPQPQWWLMAYFVERTAGLAGRDPVKISTIRKERSAISHYYASLGVPDAEWPTSHRQFRDFFAGIARRLGDEANQDAPFRRKLVIDLVALLRADYGRAQGLDECVRLALANLMFHSYLQTGARAGELLLEQCGEFESDVYWGDKAAAADKPPHLAFHPRKTKTQQSSGVKVLCAARTKHLPLDSMYWARMVLYLTRQQGRSTDDYLFSDDGTTPWTMAAAWYRYIWPRLDQLQREGKGGILATDDLDAWGSNSFRISWTTFCSNAPDPVDKTLMDKQGRWRTLLEGRMGAERMNVRYCAPPLEDLLLASSCL